MGKLTWLVFVTLMLGTSMSALAAANETPAGILQTDFVFENASFLNVHASSIVETNEGMIAAWFGVTSWQPPDFGIWISRQVAGEWTEPFEVTNGVQPDATSCPCWNPALLATPDGVVMLFHRVGPTAQQWRGVVRTSRDGGRTWSAAERLPEGIHGPVKNKPVRLADGSIITPTSTISGDTLRIHFERTTDGGRSWRVVRPAVTPDGMEIQAIQPSILIHPEGRLQAVGRTRAGRVFETWSDDNGQSWSPVTLTVLPNPNSGIDAVTLSSGHHLIVYNHTTQGRSPLNVAVSQDGLTWMAALVLEREAGEYSYPAVIQASDGLVHITYTWRRESIKHVVLDPTELVSMPMSEGDWPAVLR